MLHLLWEEFEWISGMEIGDLLICVAYLKDRSFRFVVKGPQTGSMVQGRVEAVP